MTKRQETGMAIIVAAICILIVFLSSCSTKKTVTEYVTTHDTVTIVHHDTVMDIRVSSKTDTLRELTIEKIYILPKDSGRVDTVRVEVFREIHHHTASADSTKTKEVSDDKQKTAIVQDSQKEKVKVVYKKRWWEYLIFAAIIAIVLFFILRKKRSVS